jgi:hypothetical protein
MSQIEIYTIAKVAREKLLFEYQVKDHNLHKLVAHANLYDNLLDAYYKQDVPIEEKDEQQQDASAARGVTFNIPPESLPIREKYGRETESKEERSKSSMKRKGGVVCYEKKLVSNCDHVEPSEESTELAIVDMNLEDDG